MRTPGVLVLTVLLCGLALPVRALDDLLVTGQTTLTPADVPAAGYASLIVAPGGELTILTAPDQPLTITVRGAIAIAGMMRIRAMTTTPTSNGGAVVFTVPKGVFVVGPAGTVFAGARNARGEAVGSGGSVTVYALAVAIAGSILADGSLTDTSARGGVIDLAASGDLTVDNPPNTATGTLATLSAGGYRGGLIRLRSQTGLVTLTATGLLDARGSTGTPFTASELFANSARADSDAGNRMVLEGVRLHGADMSISGTGYLFVTALSTPAEGEVY